MSLFTPQSNTETSSQALQKEMDIIAEIKKILPVTRFLCLGTVGVTLVVKLGIVYPGTIMFITHLVFMRLQVWRILTSFLLGRPDLRFIFDLVMLYRATNEVESRSYSQRSSDLAYQLMWVGPAIFLATRPLHSVFFSRSLLYSIVYLYSRLAPTGGLTSIMGIVSVPITWQPYIMLVFDLFEGKGKGPADGVVGCMVGYIWWWTVWGRNSSGQGILSPYSRAPEWLRRLMGERGPRVPLGAERSTGGGVYVTAPRQSASATTAGYRWGSGRRLGQ